LLSPRGQTGYGPHAIAAIDVALWDIKGKALGKPVWRLLGGARERVPTYATFGFSFYDREQLAAAAKQWVERGDRRLKMVVGHEALQKRDTPRPVRDVILEDERRVRAVREAVGDGPEIFDDATCSLDPYHAEVLARRIEPFGISFFEEPITQNDARLMADLRSRVGIPLAAGQNEGLAYRFRDLLVHRAVDVLQPNVVIGGGFTQCVRVAGMAAAFNVPIANGGAWPFHNMHLHAGVANGGLVEYHYPAVEACRAVYRDLPEPKDGWLTLPEKPGLGFEPDEDALREVAKRPTARGRGKG
jgi:L-alanine-DL-glutamate epimerase-like enolase superfamily enzyme